MNRTDSIAEFSESDSAVDKPKKSVRFNNHIAKTTFRASASILGRKKKNKKRSERRHRERKNFGDENKKIDLNKASNAEALKDEESSATAVSPDRKRQDSGYDSEEIFRHENSDDGWLEVKSKRNRRKKGQNRSSDLRENLSTVND